MRERVGRKHILKLSGVIEHQVSTLKLFKEKIVCTLVFAILLLVLGIFSKVENNYIKYIICALN